MEEACPLLATLVVVVLLASLLAIVVLLWCMLLLVTRRGHAVCYATAACGRHRKSPSAIKTR